MSLMSDELASSNASEPAPRRKPTAELTNSLHHVIVVGGGAAGLELVTRIGDRLAKRKKVQATLIDRLRAQRWKTQLHEVAAGSMDVGHHALDYLAQAHWHHFRYRYGEMIGLDRSKREVRVAGTYDEEGNQITEPRSFRYDTLVICVGSISNDFDTPGVKEHAIARDTAQQAIRCHQRPVNACIRAHSQPGPVRPGQLHVALIGAGATGTELAAELHRTTREVVAYGLDRIDPAKDLRITLIEAADRILPALPERISKATAGLLADLGDGVRSNAKVSRVRRDGVELANGDFIPSGLVVWAAGVKGPDVLGDLDGLEVSRTNQLIVTPTLQTTRDPSIFAIGDCAYLLPEGETRPIPPRAQAAHQQASQLARPLDRLLAGKALQPFVYRDFGSLVSLGQYSTIGSLMGFLVGKSMLIEGYFARLMYRSLYLMHQEALHGPVKVALDTIARALTRRTEPHVKLH